MSRFPKKESMKVEFKSDRKSYPDKDLVDNIVGMTNAEGGDLYLGIEDDGTVTGIKPHHADESGVKAMIQNRTFPSLDVEAELIEDEEHQVLDLRVPQSSTLIATSEGKYLIRRLKVDGTPETVGMTPAEVESKRTDLGRLDYSSKVLSVKASTALDYTLIPKLRASIYKCSGDASLLELDDDQLIHALRLVTMKDGEDWPTVAGLLLIGKPEWIRNLIPSAESAFQVIQGITVRKNDHDYQPLILTVEHYEELFNAWNPETEVMEGMFRRGIPEFSFQAFREGLVNAFSHRDYTRLQPVRVLLDDEGLTISSPGGFLPGISLEDLLTAEPRSRNPLLTDIMKRLGLAERTGRGIDRIFEGSIVYGRPLPDYSESDSYQVKLYIPRAKPDVQFTQMLSDETAKMGKPFSINALLILSYLQEERRLTLPELSNLIHAGQPRIRTAVEKLVEIGLVEGHGTGKSRDYTLSRSVYSAGEAQDSYERQKQSTDFSLNDEIIEYLMNSEPVSKNEIVIKTGGTPTAVYNALKKLQKSGKVKALGKARSTRYTIADK